MSLQGYLVALLDEVASKPTVAEVLRHAGGRAGGRIGLRDAADELRAERDLRDRCRRLGPGQPTSMLRTAARQT